MDAKTLKVKAGVARRLAKELSVYETELEVEQARATRMREDKAVSPSDLKHQENVLQEAAAMVPDSRKRLGAAYDELRATVGQCQGELLESEDFKAASAILVDLSLKFGR